MADLKGKASLDVGPFEKGLDKMKSAAAGAADGIKSRFSSLTAPLLGVGAAISAAFAGGAIVSGVADVFKLGGALSEMSDQTGISVRNLVILRKNFSDAGLEADDLGLAIGKMQRYMEEALGDEKKLGVLQEMGLSFADLRKMKPEEQFYAIGKAIAGIESPSERTAKAMELFGKSGAKLNIVFSDESFGKASDKLLKRAEMLERNAKLFDEISDRLNGPAGVLKTFYAGIADAVGPAFLAVLKSVSKIDLSGIGGGFGQALLYVFDGALTIARTILELPWGEVFKGVGEVFEGIWDAMKSAFAWIEEKVSSIAKMLSLGGLFGGGGKEPDKKPVTVSDGGSVATGFSRIGNAFVGAFNRGGGSGDGPERVTADGRRIPLAFIKPRETANERAARFLGDARAQNPLATADELNTRLRASEAAFQRKRAEDIVRARMSGKVAPDDSFDRRFHPEKFADSQVNQFDAFFNKSLQEKKPQIGDKPQGAGGEAKGFVQMLLEGLKAIQNEIPKLVAQ